jgi:uncharacterized protein (DUF302 family)
MSDYGRRIVVDLEFESAVAETSRLIREEGLKIIARIDVRDHFRRDLSHDFRRYLLIEAWSSKLAVDALRHNLEVGPVLPITVAIYELADGETAVVAKEPLAPYASNAAWRRDFPELAAMADEEAERTARVFAALKQRSRPTPSVVPAT